MLIQKPDLKFNSVLVPFKESIKKIVCHHPAHRTWGVKEIHEYHRDVRGWAGIGYNYLVDYKGNIFEGRGRNQGAHAKGHNHNTLGIAFQGNFDIQEMTDEQVASGAWLIAKLLRDEGISISDVLGHKDLKGAATACPGKNFRMDDLKQGILEVLNPRVKKEVERVSDKPSSWAKEHWDKAIALGVTDGTNPQKDGTREEFITMLGRLGLLDKK